MYWARTGLVENIITDHRDQRKAISSVTLLCGDRTDTERAVDFSSPVVVVCYYRIFSGAKGVRTCLECHNFFGGRGFFYLYVYQLHVAIIITEMGVSYMYRFVHVLTYLRLHHARSRGKTKRNLHILPISLFLPKLQSFFCFWWRQFSYHFSLHNPLWGEASLYSACQNASADQASMLQSVVLCPHNVYDRRVLGFVMKMCTISDALHHSTRRCLDDV